MKGVEALQAMVDIQSSPGNYDCNLYMWGLANGLILALATMKDESPVYLDAPKVWLDDLSTAASGPDGDTVGSV